MTPVLMRYLIVVFSLLTLFSLVERPKFGSELHQAAASSTAAIGDLMLSTGQVLASAKISGCDEFRIADRNRMGSLIKVRCVDGHRHLIRFGSPSMIDGKVVALN